MQMKLGLDARNRVRTARRDNGTMPGASLRLRRSWYAEGDPNPDDASSGSETSDTGNEASEVSALPRWAQDLIKGLRTEAGDHRQKAKQAADAKAAAEAAALVEQGKYKELYEKTQRELDALKPAQERAALLEAKIQATNDARVKRIPEAMRTVIPMDYSPDKLSEWLDANEHVLTKAPAPNLDGGAGGSGGSATTTPKLSEMELMLAKQAGITPEVYAKRKAERGAAPEPGKTP